MLRTTLARVRANAGRMVASCVAIALAVAFVAATLALTASSQRAVLDAVAGRFASSDAVVTDVPGEVVTDQGAMDPAALARAEALLSGRPWVAAVTADLGLLVDLRLPERAGRQVVTARGVTPAGPLRWQRVSAGRLPEAGGEVAVSPRLSARLGEVLTITPQLRGDLVRPRPQPVAVRVRVVGIVDLGADPTAGVRGQVFATPGQAAAWDTAASGTPLPVLQRLRVAATTGTSPEELVTRVRSVLAGDPATAGLLVATGSESAQEVADAYAGDTAGVTAALLVFAVIALVVAGLVITNTFAVVLAHRTRELALLRCVGASTAQVVRGVLAEAVVVGAGASVLGAAAGVALAAGATLVLDSVDTPVPLGAVVVPVGGLLIAVAVGTTVTVLAALVPARAAVRVPPLAALRPLEPVAVVTRRGLLRLALGLSLLVASAVGLVLSSLGGQLVPAVVAGVVNFLAVVLLAQRAVPPVVALAGRLAASVGGVPASLAAANALRDPRRTAATATALLVGVTLTASVVVGAASTRATATAQLDAHHPVDATVRADEPLPADMADRLAGVHQVAAAAAVTRGTITVDGQEVVAHGVDPVAAAATVRSERLQPLPRPGSMVVGRSAADRLGIAAGQQVTLRGPSGTRALTARLAAGATRELLLDAADLSALDAARATDEVWVRLTPGLDVAAQVAAVDRITEAAAGASPTSSVTAGAAQRQALDEIVDLLLLVMTCLLAVAVLIALLGVGNTLALSVVERRRESGLLRALGLTRRQLSATLVWEAVLVAGVAALLGTGLGVVYGAAGTGAVLGGGGPVAAVVPWLPLAGIVAASALAGALASVVPARRAARTPLLAALTS